MLNKNRVIKFYVYYFDAMLLLLSINHNKLLLLLQNLSWILLYTVSLFDSENWTTKASKQIGCFVKYILKMLKILKQIKSNFHRIFEKS